MKNVHEVLRQKELERSTLEKEVEALRVVAPLLSEDEEARDDNEPTSEPAVKAPQQTRAAAWRDRAKNWLSR